MPRNSRRRRALLVVMFIVSLGMWLGIPLAWLWVASQAQGQINLFALYLLTGIAIIISMVIAVWFLNQLQTLLAPADSKNSTQPPAWRRSMRDQAQQRSLNELELTMLLSVIVAIILLAIWFFAFARNPLLG